MDRLTTRYPQVEARRRRSPAAIARWVAQHLLFWLAVTVAVGLMLQVVSAHF
jgi:hypothetical protein